MTMVEVRTECKISVGNPVKKRPVL